MPRGKDHKLDYTALRRELKRDGPAPLYLLWGPEDYLLEDFLRELRAACMPGGESEFDLKRLNGPLPDPEKLAEALGALPFAGGRVYIELRDFELNKCRDETAGRYLELLRRIPDDCTVVLTLPAGCEPDGRLALTKLCLKAGKAVEFTAQEQSQLVKWVGRRFESLGKSIGKQETERLIFLSGDLMHRLIPEIEKAASYARGQKITLADVDAVAHHIPEADVFEMSEALSRGDVDKAVGLLSELLAGEEPPIKILAILGGQMRRLYAARVALESGLGAAFVKEVCALRFDFIARRLLDGARRYSLRSLARAVALCAEMDYRIKSSSEDDGELLKELVLRLALGGTA